MRRFFSTLSALLLTAWLGVGGAQTLPPPLTPLVLDVTLDGLHVGSSVLLQAGDALWVSEDDLHRWRLSRLLGQPLRADEVTYYPLAAYQPEVALDLAQLTAQIQLNPSLFILTSRNAAPVSALQLQQDGVGASLDYDVTAVPGGWGVHLQPQLFGSLGTLRGGVQLSVNGGGLMQTRRDAIALSHLSTVDGSQLDVGDVVLPATSTGAPFALFGALWTSGDPGVEFQPVQPVDGVAERPSRIQVSSGEQHLLDESVPPGPFRLTLRPPGDAELLQVVLTDDLGRQVRWSVPIPLANRLLPAGQSTRWMAAGLQRLSSDFSAYGAPEVSYAQRWGIRDDLTADVQLTANPTVQVFGVSAHVLVSARRLLVADTSVSASPAGWGFSGQLGVHEQHPGWAFGISARWTSDAFVPVGAALSQPAGITLTGGVSLVTNPGGALDVATTWTWPVADAANGLLSVSYTQLLSSNATLILTGSVQRIAATSSTAANPRVTVSAALLLPLTATTYAALAVTPNTLQLGVQGVTPDATLTYNVQAGLQGQTLDGRAALQLNMAAADLGVSVARLDGLWTGDIRASGRVGIVDGHAFAASQPGGAVALVQVADFPGVRVWLNGVLVGRTDRHGQLVAAGLVPLTTNRLTIDVADLPLQAQITTTEVQVTPLPGNTVKVEFPVVRVRSVLLHLTLPDGTAVPVGSVGTLIPGSTGESSDVPVAEEGLVYLESRDAEVTLQVRWPSGACTVRVTLPTTDEPLPDLGAVPCTLTDIFQF